MAVVALSARHKRTLGHELRDLVFRVFVTAGILLGGLWALHHPYVQPEHLRGGLCVVHTARHAFVRTAMQSVQKCVSSDLSGVAKAWVIPISVGALLGILAGFALASMIRLGRRPRLGRSRGRA
jgi:hypothetical protein